ncbi:arginine--tRNA ligase [Candidatus Parcubacteria bacterium]|nr:arginine--tRNA ligase [Candidatus Parcubacteria bacterium]
MTTAEIAKIITQACKTGYDADVQPEVTYAQAEFGDFSTNVAFGLAKQLKTAPRTVAERLAGEIKHPQIQSAQAAGAGFINITMTPGYWADRLAEIDQKYGSSRLGQGRKVQVEFISANPTGPLTLGNARGGFLGDVLARVLESCGYNVTREYYFNDAGTQIRKLVESVKAAAGIVSPEEVQYRGQYIQKLAQEFRAELATKPEDELGNLLTQTIFQRYLKPSIEKMGIKFDVWFNEKDLAASGQFDRALERLRREGLVYEQDGAVWLKSSAFGDERDRVLVKAGGDVTYLGNDIAYHLDIFEQRRFDVAIKEWGADHAGQVPSLRSTLRRLAPNKQLHFVIHQFVRLVREGKEVKISKRAGNIVTVDDLMDEVGPEVARFFFLMRSADSHMDFDLDLAKEESHKNPYWYVMYAHVRAHSILAQAGKKGLKPAAGTGGLNGLERQLVKQMTRFPELLQEIAADHGVHRLTFYGLELARAFHDYYESERIIDLDAQVAEDKLYLIQQFTVFMKSYFRVLGISLIERM